MSICKRERQLSICNAATRHAQYCSMHTLHPRSIRRKTELTCAKMSDRPAVSRTTQSRSMARVPAAPINSANAEKRRMPVKHTDTGRVHVMEDVTQLARDLICLISPPHIWLAPADPATANTESSAQLAMIAPFCRRIDVRISCRRGSWSTQDPTAGMRRKEST